MLIPENETLVMPNGLRYPRWGGGTPSDWENAEA